MRGSECRIDETNQTEGYYRFDVGGVVLKNAQGQPIVFARGVTKWYVFDGLGSVVGEVDVNGNLTSSPKYDVYGLVRANPGTASSAMGFVGGLGHLSEAGTGLIYMKARYYDPALGRFASQDPSKNGMNWFVYCNNNPVNLVDYTGKSASTFLKIIGDILAVIAAGLLLAVFLATLPADAVMAVIIAIAAVSVALGDVAIALVVAVAGAATVLTGIALVLGLIGVTALLIADIMESMDKPEKEPSGSPSEGSPDSPPGVSYA